MENAVGVDFHIFSAFWRNWTEKIWDFEWNGFYEFEFFKSEILNVTVFKNLNFENLFFKF